MLKIEHQFIERGKKTPVRKKKQILKANVNSASENVYPS